MSLFDDASLVLIPDGAKDGTLYSVKPTDGSGDFTFTRGSNLAATRVDENGLIEKGRENLLLYSNQFDTFWTTTNASVTSGQSGYDGSSDAWLLSISGGTSDQRILQNVQYSGVSTLSVYAKKNDSNWLSLRIGSSVNKWYDLENGVLGGSTITTAYIDASIEDVGNGWYRCSLTFTDNFNTSTRIYPAENNLDITHTSGSIYIQDAQTEVGLVATDYIETGATTAQAGILEDLPRIDYSGGASCPALLLEPQRSNLITQSEYLDAWSKFNTTITTNNAVSPDGYTNAAKLISTAVSGFHSVGESISSKLALTPYTFSFFAKADEIGYCVPNFSSTFSGTQLTAAINLTTGEVISSSAGLSASTEDYGNGWWRVILTATSQNNTTAFVAVINTTDADGNTNHTGDGTSGILVYGAQAEVGSYPTSYIPTYGSIVTRSVDTMSKIGISSLIGQEEGTLFAELKISANDSTFKFLSLSDGTNSNAVWIYYRTGVNEINFRVIVGGGSQFDQIYTSPDSTTNHKLAIRYKQDDFSAWFNGTKVLTDTSGSTFSGTTLSEFDFFRPDGINHFAGDIKQVLLFKNALTDAELQDLTTL